MKDPARSPHSPSPRSRSRSSAVRRSLFRPRRLGALLVVLTLTAAGVLLPPELRWAAPLASPSPISVARAPVGTVGQGMISPPRRVAAPRAAERPAPATAPGSRRAPHRVAPGATPPRPPAALLAAQGPVDALSAAREAPELEPRPCPAPAQARAAIFVFPHQPVRGHPVRVVALSRQRDPLQRLHLTLNGAPMDILAKRRPTTAPHVLETRVWMPRAGDLEIRLSGRPGPHATTACAARKVAPRPPAVPTWARYTEVWPVTRQWDRWTEALYSAWVARLFHVPHGGRGGWLPLHQVTRDPSRNWLHDALGWDEDARQGHARVVLLPDCGDLPYFLRAYFAWKLGLPFSFQRCTRGDAVAGPVCPVARDNLTRRYSDIPNPVQRFNQFTREWIGWGVHSGTARTLVEDNTADFYPVALTHRALRPGRIFVDPSGHVFVISQRVLGTRKEVGLLFGVDAHPDRTISRKRFSRGTFVFDARVSTGGFKAFRPLAYEDGRIRKLTNAEITQREGRADFSARQGRFDTSAAFYAAVQRVLNPEPVDPTRMYRSKILALYEAVRERIQAVALGVAYMQRAGWRPLPMPPGPAIFETTGPWEIYSTPARDLRLLMAIEDVRTFPATVARQAGPAGLYRIPDGWSPDRLRRELTAVYDALTPRLRITYRRSDGSRWTLSLADVIRRTAALRRAYHPNDCPEVRWGAPPDSAERETCTHRAALHQRARMRRHEVWFKLLRRPTLGG